MTLTRVQQPDLEANLRHLPRKERSKRDKKETSNLGQDLGRTLRRTLRRTGGTRPRSGQLDWRSLGVNVNRNTNMLSTGN
jgi:hypothetical protein